MDLLIDPEEVVGSGKYLPSLDDPEHCNALTSDLTELQMIARNSKDQTVAQLVRHIFDGDNSRPSKEILVLMQRLVVTDLKYCDDSCITFPRLYS